jgi:chaperonin GroES
MSQTQSPIKPLGDRLIVRPLTDEERGSASPFGIIIPDTAQKEKPEQGVVIAAGLGRFDEDGEKRIPMEVKVGDRIIFSKYSHDEIKVGKEEYYIVAETNVLGIFTN